MRRALLVLVLALVGLVVGATPASAHAGAVEATDYLARIDEAPDVEGLRLEVVEAGGRLRLTSTEVEVLVLGFEEEPYLRIGPDGVFENRRSPTVYLNASRTGGENPPPSATADAAPEWVRTGDGPTAAWHDHRLHWMTTDPPIVRERPGERHVVHQWALPMEVGGRELSATGEIVYEPGPATWPWLLVAAVAAAAVVAAGARRWALVAALAALVLADAGRLAGLVLIVVVDRLQQAVDVGVLPLVGWGLAVAAVVRLLTGHADGKLAAGLAGLLLAIAGGLLEWGDLGASQLAVAGPDDLGRLCTALVTGLGLGLAGAVARDALRPVSPGGR